jgi:hypothetical protein
MKLEGEIESFPPHLREETFLRLRIDDATGRRVVDAPAIGHDDHTVDRPGSAAQEGGMPVSAEQYDLCLREMPAQRFKRGKGHDEVAHCVGSQDCDLPYLVRRERMPIVIARSVVACIHVIRG